MASEGTPLVEEAPKTSDGSLKYEWSKFRKDFAVLRAGPRSLWVMYLIAFLYGFGFFLASIVIVLFLTEDLGVSDLGAGMVYGAMGLTFALAAIMEGSVPDKFGVKICFQLAGVILGVAGVVIGLAPTAFVAIMGLLLIMSTGSGIAIPVTKVGVKKYTHADQRSTAYSLLYVAVHGASAFAAVLVDVLITNTNSVGGFSIYRVIILAGAVLSFSTSIVAFFLQEIDVEETAEREPINHHQQTEYWDMLRRVAKRFQFKILLIVVLILVFVKAAYRQLDVTFPRYMRREMGDDAHFGLVLAVHPFVLVISAIIFTPLAFILSPYWIMIIGSTISGLSCFILLFGCTYYTCVLFVVCISLGEGMWNPRLYDYTLSLAPKGMEGTFMALASSPLFLSMIVAGIMSGFLLWGLCPEDGGSGCGIMWLIIGCVALISPVALLVGYRELKLEPKLLDIPRK